MAATLSSRGTRVFSRGPRARVWVTAAILIGFSLVFWRAENIFFLFFLSVLFALVLNSVSNWIARVLRVEPKWSLAITVILLLGAFVGLAFAAAPEVRAQVDRMRGDLPRAVRNLESKLNETELGRDVTKFARSNSEGSSGVRLIPKAATFLSSSISGIVAVVLVGFTTVYLAADPHRYLNGFVRLFPPAKRARVREILCETGGALERGMLGRLALMALNGIVTSVALWLMGVPMALTLGAISAILNFIPNFGPVIAAIPAALIASLQNREKVLYVILLYVAYQSLDGYILTPLVQKRAVSLPPALVLLAQALFGLLFGAIGVLIAVPFTAMLTILAKTLYIEDVLKERVEIPGDPKC